MSLIIRPMTTADIDKVHAIEKNAHRAPWSYNILKECVLVRYDCRVLEIADADFIEIIGYIIARYSLNNCHILNICIDKMHQQKGHGKYLMNQFLNSFNKPVIDTVSLEVRPSNLSALSLYSSIGFIQADVKENYYVDADSSEDAILLVKAIF